jgi:hypothetical protein
VFVDFHENEVRPYALQNCSARLIAMDERALKRLLVIVAVSIIAIFLFKTMMSKTIVNLNRAAAEKKQAVVKPPAVQQQETPASDAPTILDTPAASAVGEDTKQEPSAAY